MFRVYSIMLVVLFAVQAFAQMPHEVLLLVNRNSQSSLYAANVFSVLRQIPEQNVVYLDIPERFYTQTASITPEEFTQFIWIPATQEVAKRGLEDQLLAWVYSTDFPIRVLTHKEDRRQMSVGGVTFLRNRIPDLQTVHDGTYYSKLFAGPNQQLKTSLNSLSLAVQKRGVGMMAQVPPEAAWLQGGLRDQMPLPSMMLGYTGENGLSSKEVVACLRRGAQADHRGKRAGFYFVKSEDIRSSCRHWLFDYAKKELQGHKVSAIISPVFPVGAEQVMGIMMGAETVKISDVGSFSPGAIAEHLTSWSAEFQRPQTKLIDWIRAGATGSSGSVVEPFANPNKFPNARLFLHYTAGCTMLESFYQSIACPLQQLIIGDPLARPFALPIQVKLLGADTLTKDFTYIAQASSPIPSSGFTYEFLLDGALIQTAAMDASCFVKVDGLSDGFHELRAVARTGQQVQFGGFAIKSFVVDRVGRGVSIRPEIEDLGKACHGIRVEVRGEEKPQRLRLQSGLRILQEVEYADDVQLVLDEKQLGEGPGRVSVVAIYEDKMEVRSAPLALEVTFSE